MAITMQHDMPNGDAWIMQPTASERFNPMLIICNAIASNLNGAAYLVGGALESTSRPRDIDIRVVLPDDLFTERYGFGLEFWRHFDNHSIDRSNHWWVWKEEERRFSIMVAECIGDRNIDLAIIPQTLWNDNRLRFAGHTVVRLHPDTLSIKVETLSQQSASKDPIDYSKEAARIMFMLCNEKDESRLDNAFFFADFLKAWKPEILRTEKLLRLAVKQAVSNDRNSLFRYLELNSDPHVLSVVNEYFTQTISSSEVKNG